MQHFRLLLSSKLLYYYYIVFNVTRVTQKSIDVLSRKCSLSLSPSVSHSPNRLYKWCKIYSSGTPNFRSIILICLMVWFGMVVLINTAIIAIISIWYDRSIFETWPVILHFFAPQFMQMLMWVVEIENAIEKSSESKLYHSSKQYYKSNSRIYRIAPKTEANENQEFVWANKLFRTTINITENGCNNPNNGQLFSSLWLSSFIEIKWFTNFTQITQRDQKYHLFFFFLFCSGIHMDEWISLLLVVFFFIIIINIIFMAYLGLDGLCDSIKISRHVDIWAFINATFFGL